MKSYYFNSVKVITYDNKYSSFILAFTKVCLVASDNVVLVESLFTGDIFAYN